MLSLVLASSLWLAASEAGARPGAKAAVFQPVPVEQIADDFGRDLYWVVGSHAADLYSTAWAIHRCNGACGEGNPLGPTAEARIALKIAGAASTGLTLWKLRRDGHGRAATVLRWMTVATNAIIVTNNMRHVIKRK
jgi:hypothetical protein